MRKTPFPSNNKVHYIHLRYPNILIDSAGQIQETPGVSTKGGVTIGFRVSEKVPLNFEVALARCSPKDCFARKVGRAITNGYLNWGRSYSVPVSSVSLKEAIPEIVAFAKEKLNSKGMRIV